MIQNPRYPLRMLYSICLIVAIIYVLPVLANADQNLPNLGDSSARIIHPEYEAQLGKVFLRQVRQHIRLMDDPEIEEYIKSIGYRLVTYSEHNTRMFFFFVVDDPTINAFAGPDGIIGINSGVILNAHNESELAAVMAHEIAHVTQLHLARGFEQAERNNLPFITGLIGAILLGSQNPEAGQAALMTLQGLTVQNQLNFTRAHEKEADSVGIQLLTRAGFDPYGMPGFFQRLQQSSRYVGDTPEFLRTHPLTSSRIAEAKARASKFPLKGYFNSRTYELIHAKLEVMHQKTANDAVQLYKKKLQYPPRNVNKESLRYGYVRALIDQGNYPIAYQQLALLQAQDDENIAYRLVAAELEIKQKKYAEALSIYESSYHLYPSYRPLVLAYAKALLDSNRAVEARQLLRHHHLYSDYKRDPQFYNLLAHAESNSGHVIDAALAKSEFFYLQGDLRLAIDILRSAKRQPQLSDDQKQYVNERLGYLGRELKLEKKYKLH